MTDKLGFDEGGSRGVVRVRSEEEVTAADLFTKVLVAAVLFVMLAVGLICLFGGKG